MNYKSIAIQVGDLIKWDSSINEINRAAKSVFSFTCEPFPDKDYITSERASLFYDWVMTLAKQKMNNENRNSLLVHFCENVTSERQTEHLNRILNNAQIKVILKQKSISEFNDRGFHEQIGIHCKALFKDGHYFHAVFESTKAYNKFVKEKSQSSLDGQALMQNVWGWKRGVLKITPCNTDTDKNIQEGMSLLSAGLMGAFRNPTAHEPAIAWPISKEDCLDILSFISFLFKKLDNAVFSRINHED